MKTDLPGNEKMLRKGAANLQRGVETVGGTLFLTDQRLVFESHAFNIQTGATEIPLHDVVGIRRCWTRFLGLVPIMPNSLAVTTTRGAEYRFVLSRRAEWEAAIGAQATLAAPNAVA